MRIAKKLLCTVLSLCMIASTIVFPMLVEAVDYIVNEIFDGKTETGLLGTTV